MKIFIAALDTETNTFAPLPTGARAFADGFVAHGDATSRPENYCSAHLYVWRRRAEALGWEVAESLCAYAEPGGITTRPVFEGFRDEILRDLEAAKPDIVLLALHGAMVADGYEDCEGEVLTRVRAIVGPAVPIGVELDLHCHLTDAMVDSATVLLTYKEYPHVDIPARADDLFTLIEDAAAGRTQPVMAVFDCRMIGMFRPTAQPMRDFVDHLAAHEGRDGILSLSLIHGFPWADVADVGVKLLAVADGDAEKAAATARHYGEALFAQRKEVLPHCLTIDAALEVALELAEDKPGFPIVIADVADNPGGGAPGDATFFLQAALERRIARITIGYLWDPMAVRFCQEAGLGASLDLRIGGKCGVSSGTPVDLSVQVMGLADEVYQRFGDAPVSLGACAWVQSQGINIILCSLRGQAFHPEAMVTLGLDPATQHILVVKSNQHFYAGFAPIAGDVLYASSPGALSQDFGQISYTRRSSRYWPRDEDPFCP
ncbi:M81 family metallopeptidase [Acidisoma cellulosilytica]|uniref:Microcystinase C n=1 Tax=Acidisoma cellulosilyticum TaxID=2802395 RepID=A0A964E2L0_9PROT|nr:M81 family metallopeptidase [Acidisoma cellulosilyticum]MCB8879347.1 M81 family metallopeptidase [Acidisoma cellulosilyticum]